MTSRSSGLLVHPTSLPGRFGVGDFGPEAEAFLDWAVLAGQTLWQVMPLGPTGFHNSPYNALSAFAGNPLLVSPERLFEEDFLPAAELKSAPAFPKERVDFASVIPWKERVLRASWDHFLARAAPVHREELEAFITSPEQADWLDDWSLFMALTEKFGHEDWTRWGTGLVRREAEALKDAHAELGAEVAYQEYLQFLFFRQWGRLKAEANRRGVHVFGDIPIYLALGSADVWAHQRLFTLGADGRPETVAGVPPDYFSDTGQLWGNPLFRWDVLEEDGFSWWVERMRANFRMADLVRIDHFRGFAAFWEVKSTEETALRGRWVTGPGTRLFDALGAALGDVPIVAEDLGHITDDVKELLRAVGFPGMRVLQFAFGEVDSDYLPHNFTAATVVYTGTHDNDTTRGWFAGLGDAEKRRALAYVGSDGREIEWDLIRAATTSVADRAVVPLQDVFGLGSEARMNMPGQADGNWAWRGGAEDFTPERAARLRELAELTGRWSGPSGGRVRAL